MSGNDTVTILLVGVGGQGIIRASDILSVALMEAGYDVKKSEVHGMAQRGGCVSSHVRYGKKVYSPLANEGGVDILMSFEKVETLRYLHFLKPDGTVIVNEAEIYPLSVNLGEAEYPSNVIDHVKSRGNDVIAVDASQIACREGSLKMANTVMLGVLSKLIDVDISIWEQVFKESFPAKLAELNLKAFAHVRES